MFTNHKKTGASGRGFTLVEIMVAVSIFSIVALIATSALINANQLSQKAQATKLVMDNLNFALDSMLFKIRRTGQVFYCSNTHDNFPTFGSALSCSGGSALVLSSADDPGHSQVMYFFDATDHALKLATNDDSIGESEPVRLTSSAVNLSSLVFKVYNAAGESGWPRVEIALAGMAQVGHATSTFALETTATARQ